MPNRSRYHRGRDVLYNPTAAEVVTFGPGQWPGMITKVNANGTVDLVVDPPQATVVGAAFADPLVTTANANAQGAGYVQADAQTVAALANANKVAINALVTRLNQLIVAAGRRASVREGGQPGQFTFQTGHAAS